MAHFDAGPQIKSALDQLKLACIEGNALLCRLALNSVKNADMPLDALHNTALMFAVDGRHTQVVRVLLQHGADPTKRNWLGASAIHRACLHGQATILAMLLDHDKTEQNPAIINAPLMNLDTPFLLATQSHDVATLRLLRECDVNVDAILTSAGETAMCLLARKGDVEGMIHAAVICDAEFRKDRKGVHPLDLVSESERREITDAVAAHTRIQNFIKQFKKS